MKMERLHAFFLATGLFLSCALAAQDNLHIALLAQANDFQLSTVQGDLNYNDVWGYVDPSGREYGIIGAREGTAVYDLADPRTPRLVGFVPGARSIWRDIKSFGHYLYVVADQGADGILVIDMSAAPDSLSWQFVKPVITQGAGFSTLERCHNLFIDDAGYVYLSGCNINNGGVVLFRIEPDTGVPEFVSFSAPRYSHDNFSRGDTVWSADVYAGVFSVIDVSDKQNPVTLATQGTGNAFTHNVWLSDDGHYLFTTDERANAFVESYDVRDLDNIQFLDAFRPLATEGRGVIPHNVHYYQGYLVTSYYTDGVVITDAHRPDNLIQVANFDTWPGPDGGFEGSWGAYPFLPSGTLLVSDVFSGLYVLEVDYRRACYLDGQVTDRVTGEPLTGVEITIDSPQPNQGLSGGDGRFRTGQQQPGTFEVVFRKTGYFEQRLPVELQPGQTTELTVELTPIQRFAVDARVADRSTNATIPFSRLYLEGDNAEFFLQADSSGRFLTDSIFAGEYRVYAGAWGYQTTTVDVFNFPPAGGSLVIELDPGYMDDFTLDLGWETSSTAATGHWVREAPIGTYLFNDISNPDRDVEGDLGSSCYVTGNGGGQAGFDDVDNGVVTLTSPPMDLSRMQIPQLSYARWFYNAGGETPINDTLYVSLVLNDTSVLLEKVTGNLEGWKYSPEFALAERIDLSQPVRLQFVTSDLNGAPHVVEAGVDDLRVIEGTVTGIETIQEPVFSAEAFPNPFHHAITLKYRLSTLASKQGALELSVFNALGQLIEQRVLPSQAGDVQLGHIWQPGWYFLQLTAEGRPVQVMRVVKGR